MLLYIRSFVGKTWNKIPIKWKAVIGIISVIVLLITFAQRIDWLKDTVLELIEEEVVFRTTYVLPDVNEDTHDLCVFPGKVVVPIANPEVEGEGIKEAAGPRYNIIFTVTNKSNEELLVDGIEAYLTGFQRLPEKYIVTIGPHAVLRPIDLYLNLNSSQSSYDMLEGRYLSIESGKTEHVFKVWVSGEEPGIYQFKIRILGREGGNKEKVIESDEVYEFVVADYESSPKCLFLYGDRNKNDPNFEELFKIADMPIKDFKEITSKWGEFRITDSLFFAPEELKNFIRDKINIEMRGASGQISATPFNKPASGIILSENDLNSVWGSLTDADGNPIEVLYKSDDLPYWLIEKYEPKYDKMDISAKTIKLVQETGLGLEVIYNTIAVYPTIELAEKGYSETISLDGEFNYYRTEDVGDESYYMVPDGIAMRVLVFRKGNVVAVIVGMPGPILIDKYAEVLEEKILN